MKPKLKSLILDGIKKAHKQYGRAVNVHEIRKEIEMIISPNPLPVLDLGRELRRLADDGDIWRTGKNTGMYFIYEKPNINNLGRWNQVRA